MAALTIIERRVASATLFALSGQLVADEGDRAFIERVSAALASGRVHIVVDLRGITYVDSGGVGALVASYLQVQRAGGRLKLVRPSPRVWRVLRMTHLASVFEIYDSEDEAVCSFTRQPLAVSTDAQPTAAR